MRRRVPRHVEACTLWAEALATFGTRADELTFLRSRAVGASRRSDERIAPTDTCRGSRYRAPSDSDAGFTNCATIPGRHRFVGRIALVERGVSTMTLRGMLGSNVHRIQEQIDDLLDREDGLIVLFDGTRMVSYSRDSGISRVSSSC